MKPVFVSTHTNNALGLTFSIFFDSDFNEYQVRSKSNVILFRAENRSLAWHGIRTYHLADYCGSKLTERGVQ